MLRYNTWTTGYNFELTSLLVSDELDEGIPVAHCISNKKTFSFMEIFFKEVQSTCGLRRFMSDTASQFYNAFALISEVSAIQLICRWHVDKAWCEELRQKVSSIECLPKKSQWSYCYPVSLGINTNMFCKAFHEVLSINI